MTLLLIKVPKFYFTFNELMYKTGGKHTTTLKIYLMFFSRTSKYVLKSFIMPINNMSISFSLGE
jgi:hypothetical protein